MTQSGPDNQFVQEMREHLEALAMAVLKREHHSCFTSRPDYALVWQAWESITLLDVEPAVMAMAATIVGSIFLQVDLQHVELIDGGEIAAWDGLMVDLTSDSVPTVQPR